MTESSIEFSKNFTLNEMKIYAQGFADGMSQARKLDESTRIGVDEIMARYGCGQNRARSIIQSIRRACNGGKTGAVGFVLRCELEYWESFPEKIYKQRL